MRATFGPSAPSQSSVSSWLRGEFTPRVDHIAMLADVLGVRPAWLAFNDGAMAGGVVDDERRKREFLEEQQRLHPRRPNEQKGKGRRAG